MGSDDELHEFDLSAWEAPPPPVDLADAVIGRVLGTQIGAAIPPDAAPRRVWRVAAIAVAAVVVALGLWGLVHSTERALRTSGAVTATRPQRLALPGATVDLDVGADVRWQRQGNMLHVEQRAGTASWELGEDAVVIDAAKASIEATGASLRVEVAMNASDAKVIGASAVTAAAVALVTVIVYEGHVKVAREGQTVIVEPGSTYRVGEPPAPPAPEPEPVPTAVGGGLAANDVNRVDLECKEAIADKKWMDLLNCATNMAQFDRARAKVYSDQAHVEQMNDIRIGDLGVAVKDGDLPKARKAYEAITPDSVYLSNAESKFKDFEKSVVDGYKQRAQSMKKNCASLEALQRQATPLGQPVVDAVRPFVKDACNKTAVIAPPPPNTSCDADVFKAGGDQDEGIGQHGAALAKYEQAAACRDDELIEKLAYLAACNAGNAAKARLHFQKLPTGLQERLKLICVRQGISEKQLMRAPDTNKDAPPANCDADALKAEGDQEEGIDQHVAALGKYEASLRCKPDSSVYRLAFMTACNADNVPKARLYYWKLEPAMREKLKIICLRQGIREDQLSLSSTGYLQVNSKPPARVRIDGKDTGLTTPIAGKKLELSSGKHKVTLVIDGDSFTYPVVIKAGETETMSKDLQ